MKKTLVLSVLLMIVTEIYAVINPFAKWTKTQLVLCNGIVSRTIKLPSEDSRFLTVSYKPLNGDFNSFSDTCTDFQFEVNDIIYSGREHWALANIQVITGDNEGSGAAVKLISQDKKIELTLKFLMYPNSPA